MTQFLQATVSGLSLAAIYALIAVGFVVIFKSTQVLSFAQPALVLMGAYFVSYFAFSLGWNFWIGLGLAVLIAVLAGLTVERIALRPMIGKPVFSVAILTIGLDIAIRTVINDLIGVDFGPELPVDARPQILCELCRDAGGIIIGGFQNLRILH